MKKTNKLYKIKWGTFVFFSEIYNYIIIGKSNSLIIYNINNNELIFNINFKHSNFAIESIKHKKLFVKNTTGQVCVIDYEKNEHKILKRKIGEGYTSFFSHDEDNVIFIDWKERILIINIYNLKQILCYDILELFESETSIKFLKKSHDTLGYIFTFGERLSRWDNAVNTRFIDIDLFKKTYKEIYYLPSTIAAPYQNTPTGGYKYIPELDSYIIIYNVVSDISYIHVKFIKSAKEIFSFNTGNFASYIISKTFFRKEQEIYICLSPETIILFDFNYCKITKIYTSAQDIMEVSYNKKTDELILIYVYGSDIITIDDFLRF